MAELESDAAAIETPRGAPLVVLEDVNKHFGALHVLKDIDLSVARGEVVVVIGPSGSGKSTLCRVINRLETIDSGRITIDGAPLPAEGRALARLRADVGMVFQSFNLFSQHDRARERHARADARARLVVPGHDFGVIAGLVSGEDLPA